MGTIPLITQPVSADKVLPALNALIDQINGFLSGLSPESVDITGGTITGVTIDNSVIGGITPAAGSFTTFTAISGNISGDTIVTRTAAQTLTNKALTAPVIIGGTIDNAVIGGITPAAGSFTSLTGTSGSINGDTIVTLTAIQTLTNKTFTLPILTVLDGSFTLQNTADVTKQAQFSLSSLTTGNLRTYMLPDVSSTLVALSSTNAFTAANTFLDGANLKLLNVADNTKTGTFSLAGLTTGINAVYALPNLAAATLATISNLTQTFTGACTFSNTLSVTAATATLGSAVTAATYGIGNGATTSAVTKTINMGTAGLSGSITNINVGSAIAGSTGTLTSNIPLIAISPIALATVTTPRFQFTAAADTTLTTATEATEVNWNLSAIRTHATGAIALQRDFRIQSSTHAFAAASTITDAAGASLDGPPIAGTNATFTNAHGLYLPTKVLTGTITNAFGLTVAAPSGATNNFAANFTGSIGLSGSAGNFGQVFTSGGNNASAAWSTPAAGTVTSISVASSNGFAGTSSGGATPALTLSTSITGILQGNGTAISAASVTGTGAVVQAASPTLTGTVNLPIATFSGKITNYNSIATSGQGVPSIYGSGRSAGVVASVPAIVSYTVGAADGSFIISANVLITASTTNNFTVVCVYTDESNTSRTLILTFSQISGTFLTAITNVTGVGAYEGVPLHIRAKAGTAITLGTSGIFTSVTYNVEAYITQIG